MANPPPSENEISDLALMAALRDGEASALRSLIARWEKRLLSFIYRYTQNTHVTQDIVQEVFVRVYHRRAQFDAQYGFAAWLFTIAANLCRNHARWRGRHPSESWDLPAASEGGKGPNSLDQLVEPSSSPFESTVHHEELRVLKRLVMALPHDLKTAVLLHHYEGLSAEEISRIVDCSPRGVETRIYRALKRLKAAKSREFSEVGQGS